MFLKIDTRRNAVKIISEEDSNRQYGYVFLDSLHPTYNYIDFDYSVCSFISDCLIGVLQTYEDHSAQSSHASALEGENNITEGIYQAMAHADEDGIASVVVSWENNVQQDPDGFEADIKREIFINCIYRSRLGRISMRIDTARLGLKEGWRF
jgi:hypothetical protein